MTAAWAVVIALLAGCNSLRIDPTGERIFTTGTPGVTSGAPGSPTARPVPQQPGIALTPPRIIAPVGGEVIVVATLFGENGLPERNRQVEWIVSPDSAGYFVTPRGFVASYSLGHYPNPPHKISNSYALGKTLPRSSTVTRGNGNPADDVVVGEGQAWITVSSPTEGSTHVTAYAPQIENWERHSSSATVHWVDAQWTPPPSSTNAVGTREPLTTTVLRASDGSPVQGWNVRYEVVSGPPAGFSPDGAPSVEVPTDAAGQATAELFQSQPQAGVNRIKIDLVRPAGVSFSEQQPLLIGSTTIDRTWTAPDIALQMSGPAMAGIGATLTYRITVSNPGDLPATGVTVSAEVPAGLSYVTSLPAAGQQTASSFQWSLGDLPAKQNTTVELTLQADAAATANVCADVQTSEGLAARDCVATTITEASVEVSVQGPGQGQVGQDLPYTLMIRNRGGSPTPDLLLVDRFDDGLEFRVDGQLVASPIESDVAAIPPGGSRTVDVRFKALRTGRFCQVVEVQDRQDKNRKFADTEFCVDISAAPAAPAAGVTVTKTGPVTAKVGETIQFESVVRNTGTVAIYNLQVYDEYDDVVLKPTLATRGIPETGESAGELIWTIDRLLPGESRSFTVQCQCMQAAQRVCPQVTLTGPNNLRETSAPCVDITPGPPAAPPNAAGDENPVGLGGPLADQPRNISVSIVEPRGPFAVSDLIPITILVTNVGTVAESDVTLEVALPPTLQFDRMSPTGRDTALISGTGGILRFRQAQELRANGDSLRYIVNVRAVAAGPSDIVATVTSRSQATPLETRRSLEIVATGG